jgi:hypothetical protein
MALPHLASKEHPMKPPNIWLRFATYGIAVLSTVCVSTGVGCQVIHPLGLSNGMSQQGGETSDRLSHSALPTVASPQVDTSSAITPRLVALADPYLASTAAKREQLTYLVRCALPEGIELYTQQGTERFTFPGRIGLAPHWVSTAMTPSEERWVSACLLAHLNYFGKHVMISLRAQQPLVPALEASNDEQQTFSIFEGGFFGNLFTPNPVAYTCRGQHTIEQASDPILQDRICTQETGETAAEGKPLTHCRLILTGDCEDDHSFIVDGQPYAEVIFTYLKPSHRQ